MNFNNNEKIINYLGLDWGEKRIGIATADSETRLALPFMTVSSLKELLPILKAEETDKIILGEPVKMRGEASNNPAWLNFYDNLKKESALEIILIDERMSSLGADSLGGDKKQRASRDEISASIILQNYLDKNFD